MPVLHIVPAAAVMQHFSDSRLKSLYTCSILMVTSEQAAMGTRATGDTKQIAIAIEYSVSSFDECLSDSSKCNCDGRFIHDFIIATPSKRTP